MKADFALGMMLIKLRPCGKRKQSGQRRKGFAAGKRLPGIRDGRTGRERGCAGGRFALFSDKT